MIRFSPKASSLWKAALLTQIYKDTATVKSKTVDPGLFGAEEDLDADAFDLAELTMRYKEQYGIDAGWLDHIAGKQITNLLQYNLRHTPPDYPMILEALTQALCLGPQYCLQSVSQTARKFHNCARTVQHEVHRMVGFIRFKPAGDDMLVAQPKLFHYTADLILRRFQARYPEHKLVLVLDHYALTICNNRLSQEEIQPYLPFLQADRVEELWECYYTSQFIESRENISLAQQRIPQKYWDWMREGTILQEYKKKS